MELVLFWLVVGSALSLYRVFSRDGEVLDGVICAILIATSLIVAGQMFTGDKALRSIDNGPYVGFQKNPQYSDTQAKIAETEEWLAHHRQWRDSLYLSLSTGPAWYSIEPDHGAGTRPLRIFHNYNGESVEVYRGVASECYAFLKIQQILQQQ